MVENFAGVENELISISLVEFRYNAGLLMRFESDRRLFGRHGFSVASLSTSSVGVILKKQICNGGKIRSAHKEIKI